MIRWLIAFATLLSISISAARAEVTARYHSYSFDNTQFDSLVVSDTEISGRRPGVLVADEHGAMSSAARTHANQIARLGYVVVSVDLYGKGNKPDGEREMAEKAGLTAPDHKQVRGRMQAVLKLLLKQPGVNSKQIAGVGYGVGGTALIELARTGVDLEGVVDVGGEVDAGLADDREQIQPTMLVLVGAEDSHVSDSQLKAFEKEMKADKVQCNIVPLPGAVHDFANPRAGDDRSSGSAYDAAAAGAAFEQITTYLADEIPLKSAPAPEASEAGGDWPKQVPRAVAEVLRYVDEHGEPMEGYEGGRTFGNYEHHLPATERSGRRIKYREWDVNPHRPGVNRGVERLITGADGSAYYTDDHYNTFTKIR